MCIALLSTAHPSYPLILIDNRDEFLSRPTAEAAWWPEPFSFVLGGRDLLREIQGTWLGVTKAGKIAVLTNYREDVTPPITAISRGAIVKKFLAEDVGPVENFVKEIVNTGIARDAGGFSLVCGHIGQKLAVISNRAENQSQVPWIAGDLVQTVGLSNTAFDDRTWKKVLDGEELLLKSIRASIEHDESEGQLIARLFAVLSRDTLPRSQKNDKGGLESYIMELRNTIFVPKLGRKNPTELAEDEVRAAKTVEKVEVLDGKTSEEQNGNGRAGYYATQKQTVCLVDHEMNVRFIERTLYDNDQMVVPEGKGDVDFKFKIAT